VPTSWDEVTDPKWKGKVIISASGEEMPARFAHLWKKDGELDWERSFDFWTKLFQQEPLIAKGYRIGAESIAAGEKTIFWVPASGPPTMKALYDNAPLNLIAFPTFLASFRSQGITKGAPHPACAWLFLDYLTSPEGQHWFTDVVSAKGPMNTKAKPGAMAEFMMKAGATFENSDSSASDYSLDGMAAVVYNPENQKKSENFFLELMGVK